MWVKFVFLCLEFQKIFFKYLKCNYFESFTANENQISGAIQEKMCSCMYNTKIIELYIRFINAHTHTNTHQ